MFEFVVCVYILCGSGWHASGFLTKNKYQKNYINKTNNETTKMHLPQNYISIVSLLLLALHSCESSPYSQLTIVNQTINEFFNKEVMFWDEINATTNPQALNTTLTAILNYFDTNFKILTVGNSSALRMINAQLAGYIDSIKRTQHTETRWLEEKRYDDNILHHCEIITSAIPAGIDQIFEITKSPTFMTYLRENSDFCQTNKRIVSPGVEDLQLQNVVMDFYVTVAETLVKGYMTSQMAHMVQTIKGKC